MSAISRWSAGVIIDSPPMDDDISLTTVIEASKHQCLKYFRNDTVGKKGRVIRDFRSVEDDDASAFRKRLSSSTRGRSMELDSIKTAVAFIVLIAIGVGGLLGSGVMAIGTVLMMVLPAMVIFGLICLGIGVWHGQYRATSR
jgi:hypothetical protein